MKTLVNFSISNHVVAAFKLAVPPGNRSSAIEGFMSAMARIEESNTEEEEEVLKRIDDLRRQSHELHQSLIEESARLEMIKADKARRDAEGIRKLEEHRDMVDRSGIREAISRQWR